MRGRIFIILMIIIAVGIWLYAKPISTNKTYESYMCSYDKQFSKTAIVKITGQINRGLFTNHKFIGTVDVDGYNYNIVLDNSNSEYFGLLSDISDDGYTEASGFVRLSSDLRYVWVNLNDINDKYNCDHIDIYGPAGSEAEAMVVNTRLGD